jgi:tetratricopeptide (TPR) repeat protein
MAELVGALRVRQTIIQKCVILILLVATTVSFSYPQTDSPETPDRPLPRIIDPSLTDPTLFRDVPQLADAQDLNSISRLIQRGRLKEARERLRDQIASKGESHETLYLEAKILFKEKKFMESLKVLERCLSMEQHDPEVYMLIASNAILLNKMDIAERSLTSALQLTPNDYMLHLHLGLLHYTQGHFRQGESELRQVVRLKPDFMKGYDILGGLLEDSRQDQAAIQCYRKAIELTKSQGLNDDSGYRHLGMILLKNNEYQASLSNLQEAVEVNPKSAEAFYFLGKVWNALGDISKAQDALERSIRNDPTYAASHYLLSRIYRAQGKAEAADREMQIFQEFRKAEDAKTRALRTH